eukprot:2984386-Pyramimonas_sp.AAC.1
MEEHVLLRIGSEERQLGKQDSFLLGEPEVGTVCLVSLPAVFIRRGARVRGLWWGAARTVYSRPLRGR